MRIRKTSAALALLLGLSLSAAGVAAHAQDSGDGPAVNEVKGSLSVMVLGSGGPQLQASGRASAGYLIFTDGQPRVLMDLGGGTFQRIGQSGAHIGSVDIVLLSHLHIDHTADLPAVVKGIYFDARLQGGSRTAPVRIWGPDGSSTIPDRNPAFPAFPSISDYLAGLFGGSGLYAYLPSFVKTGGLGTFAYTPTGLPADFNSDSIKTIVNENGLMISEIAVDHFEAPAVAYRIKYKGRTIVYSGDTHSTTDNLANLAMGADLLIYDTSILDTAPPAQSPFAKRHTTPTRIGQVAALANPRKLVLSHITPISEPAIATIEQIIRDQGYVGRISAAHDLKVYNVGMQDD
jgi:ribonuclease BN (tRNA processing enzyme)